MKFVSDAMIIFLEAFPLDKKNQKCKKLDVCPLLDIYENSLSTNGGTRIYFYRKDSQSTMELHERQFHSHFKGK